jgi:hypothetical protein
LNLRNLARAVNDCDTLSEELIEAGTFMDTCPSSSNKFDDQMAELGLGRAVRRDLVEWGIGTGLSKNDTDGESDDCDSNNGGGRPGIHPGHYLIYLIDRKHHGPTVSQARATAEGIVSYLNDSRMAVDIEAQATHQTPPRLDLADDIGRLPAVPCSLGDGD